MGLDVFRRKCPAHNRILKLREACPDCVALARTVVRDAYRGEESRDHERGPPVRGPLQWFPVGLHPDTCEHRRCTAIGKCYDCGATSRQVVLDRLNLSLGFR
jgi:hypothetical protein